MLPAAIFAAGVPGFAGAETLKAAPEQPLQAVLDRAQDGDVIELAPGEYKGAIRIDRRVGADRTAPARCSTAAAPATSSR